MIDTLMALWNQGTRGRGILVTTAFFIICISISLLLIPIENIWTSWLSHQGNSPGDQTSIISSTDLTATARANNIQPTTDNTTTIYAPTTTPQATPTKPSANPCTVTPVPHTTPVGTTPSRGGYSPTPTPTATHGVTPTSTPIPSPTPTNTPIISPTPTNTRVPSPTPTNTPVSSPTPTHTPVPSVTPTGTPTASVTPTNTPIASVTPTPRKTPTVPATLTIGEGSTHSGQPLQGNNPWHTNCLHIRAGDSLDMYSNAHILATLERNLGFILAGSTLGTLFFYVIIYLLVRRKKV